MFEKFDLKSLSKIFTENIVYGLINNKVKDYLYDNFP